MGFNLPGWFLPLIAVLALVAIALGIVKIIRLSRSSEKPRDKKTNGYRAVTLLCVVVMFASWIINIGWLRIFLTWIPIPLVHTIAFIIVNFKAIKNIAYSDKLKKYVPWSWGTYLTAYLLFPDGGDDGVVRAFFNLLRDEVLCTAAMCVAIICFISNVVILILESDVYKKTNAKEG